MDCLGFWIVRSPSPPKQINPCKSLICKGFFFSQFDDLPHAVTTREVLMLPPCEISPTPTIFHRKLSRGHPEELLWLVPPCRGV